MIPISGLAGGSACLHTTVTSTPRRWSSSTTRTALASTPPPARHEVLDDDGDSHPACEGSETRYAMPGGPEGECEAVKQAVKRDGSARTKHPWVLSIRDVPPRLERAGFEPSRPGHIPGTQARRSCFQNERRAD